MFFVINTKNRNGSGSTVLRAEEGSPSFELGGFLTKGHAKMIDFVWDIIIDMIKNPKQR